MNAKSISELFDYLNGVVAVDGDTVTVVDESALTDKVDAVVYTAVFGDALARDTARWLLWEIGQAIGVYPASIHELYMDVGSDDVPANFTVPAINVRAMNYTTARAIFRAANAHQVGSLLFEIARSEIGYTGQRPTEYTASLIAAAIKEGYRGPLFIQGDHFQISAARYKSDPDAEMQAVKDLMDEAVAAGFYNIDIDTSTLVDLSYDTLDEQQRLNYTLCAELTKHARAIEPEEITISLGGEIGEVGHKNSTVAELDAFMAGYLREMMDTSGEGKTLSGISKISVQTGTSHGGVVLPDGTLADVSVDFETLRDLSRTARDSYGLGGAVQHGASTLPQDAFGKFPEVGTVEIHLATGFQNMVFDHLPADVVKTAYDYLRENHKSQWKEGQTEDQFLYSNRKRAIGEFKQQWWDLSADVQAKIGEALEKQFAFLFEKLNVYGTRRFADKAVTQAIIHKPRPREAVADAAEEDVSDLAD